MSLIGHCEFGLDYMPQFENDLKCSDFDNMNDWLEQGYLTYDMLSHFLNGPQVLFVCYEELCKKSFSLKINIKFC